MDLKNMQGLMELQKESMKIKKEIENTQIESEIKGLVITINGDSSIEKVEFETDELVKKLDKKEIKELSYAIKEALNKGVKKHQEFTSEKMQSMVTDLGMGDFMKGMGR